MFGSNMDRGWTADASACRATRWPAMLSALVFVLAVPGASFGQTIWNAGVGDWNTPTNWSLGVPNSASGTAFDAVIENGGTAQILIPGGSVRRLRVGRTAGDGNLLVSGGELTVSGDFYMGEGGAGGGQHNRTTIQLGGIITAPTTVVGYSGARNSDFLITGAASRVNATTSFVVGRAGFGALTLADGGTLAIGNGTLPLQVGTLAGSSGHVSIGNGGAAGVLQASAVQFGAGSGDLRFDHTGHLPFATPISGPGSVIKRGLGTATLSATNSYTGITIVGGGTLAVSADANLGTPPGSFVSNQLVLGGGTLRATQSFTMAATRGIEFSTVGTIGGTIEVDATKTLTYLRDVLLNSVTMTKTGAGTLQLPTLVIGGLEPSALVVTGGGTLATVGSTIGPSGGFGSATVSGPGTTWTTDSLKVGFNGAGTLEIFGGGTVTTNSSSIANSAQSTGTVTVRGAGSTWNAGGDLNIGDIFGYGALNIEDQALVHVGELLYISPSSVVNLSGGTLRFNGYLNQGTFNFNSGTIQLAGDRSVGTDAVIEELFGAAPILTSGKGLTVEGTATLLTAVTLDGGTLTFGGLASASGLQLKHGTFTLTNQALTIGAGGLLGGTLDLASDVTVNVTLGIQNQGLVTGDGQLGGTFNNAVGGELRAERGRSLVLTGAGNANSGQINLLGGLVEFTQNLTNNAGGFISGNGALIVRGGLLNHATMNFSGSTTVAGDVTNSATGKVISTGGGATIFFDDVTNQGEIRTSTGGFTLFFGAVAGAGTFTGLGSVIFEGDLKPGNSPAAIQFAGNLAFGPSASLEIEIGGLTPGTGHDRITVGGTATLNGRLDIVRINNFVPANGDRFTIITFASHDGTFPTVTGTTISPTLAFHPLYSATELTLIANNLAEKTWGVDASGAASVGANWFGGVAPGGVGDATAFTTIITANRTVTLDQPLVLGSIRFDDDNNYTIVGPNTLTLQNSVTQPALLTVQNTHGNGAHTINTPIEILGDLVITQDSTQPLAIGGPLDSAAGRAITKAGAGTLIANRVRAGALTVNAGSLVIAPNGGDPGTSAVDSLSVNGTSRFDLNNNDLVVRATAATKDAVHGEIEADIVSAQNGLDANLVTKWDGPGLTSSTARAANVAQVFDLTGIGVIRNSDLDTTTGIPDSSYTSFSGQTVGPDDVLVKYTYIGDANLSGAVSFDDYVGMDNAFFGLIPNLGWATGDINFDGLINFDDYSKVDQAFFFQGAPLSGEAGVAAVPEPGTWALLMIACLGVIAIRQVRSCRRPEPVKSVV